MYLAYSYVISNCMYVHLHVIENGGIDMNRNGRLAE